VAPDSLAVLSKTEQMLIPERGVMLGNVRVHLVNAPEA
jgi:hypothetical protein